MPYLNIDLDYFEHPKTRRLVAILGRGAELLPVRLWAFCGKFHYEDGALSGYAPAEIEAVAGWWGAEGEMVQAMIKVGFMDIDSESSNYRMHNWESHQGHIGSLKQRAKDAAQKRWNKIKNAPSNATSMPPACPEHAPGMPKQCSVPFHSIPYHSIPSVVGETNSQPSEPAAPEAATPSPVELVVQKTPRKQKPHEPVDDQAWIASLKSSPAYSGIDVDRELSKCLIHFDTKGIKVSRRRFLNWLNRTERPIAAPIRPVEASELKMSTHTAQKQLELVEKEIKEIRNRSFEDAFGPKLRPQDVEPMRKLKTQREELKKQLGLA